MVTALFKEGQKAATTTSLQKYDYGEVLRIKGLSLPRYVAVQFAVDGMSEALPSSIGETVEDVTDVLIPNSLLRSNIKPWNYNIMAYVYIVSGSSGKTEYTITIPVKWRPKTGDDQAADDDVAAVIGSAVEKMNTATTKAENAANQASATAEEIKADREKITTNEAKISGLKSDLFDVQDVCFTENNENWSLIAGYIGVDGRIVQTPHKKTDYCRATSIQVKGGTYIKVLNDSTELIFAQYDSSDSLIKRDKVNGIGVATVSTNSFIKFSISDSSGKEYEDSKDALSNIELHLKTGTIIIKLDEIDATKKKVTELGNKRFVTYEKEKLISWSFGELQETGVVNEKINSIRFKQTQVLKKGMYIDIPSQDYKFNVASFNADGSMIRYLGSFTKKYVIESDGYYMASFWRTDDANMSMQEADKFIVATEITSLITDYNYNRLSEKSKYNKAETINFGKVPFDKYIGQNTLYDSETLNRNTTYLTIISMFDALVNTHNGYLSKVDRGLCSDGTNHVYQYNAVPEKLTYGGKKKAKPKMLIISGQQAMEKGCIYGLYYFLKDLCENWKSNDVLSYIRHNVTLKLIPIVNPYSFNTNSYYNINNVNLNRNYDTIGFYVAKKGTTNYGGLSPFDQIETTYVKKLVDENHDAICFIDCHTDGSGELSNYQLNWIDVPQVDDEYFEKILPICENHIINLTEQFFSEYPDMPLNELYGTLTYADTFKEGSPTADAWVATQNIIALTCEGFCGFPNKGTFTSDVLKANSEIIGNLIKNILLGFSCS